MERANNRVRTVLDVLLQWLFQHLLLHAHTVALGSGFMYYNNMIELFLDIILQFKILYRAI